MHTVFKIFLHCLKVLVLCEVLGKFSAQAYPAPFSIDMPPGFKGVHRLRFDFSRDMTSGTDRL